MYRRSWRGRRCKILAFFFAVKRKSWHSSETKRLMESVDKAEISSRQVYNRDSCPGNGGEFVNKPSCVMHCEDNDGRVQLWQMPSERQMASMCFAIIFGQFFFKHKVKSLVWDYLPSIHVKPFSLWAFLYIHDSSWGRWFHFEYLVFSSMFKSAYNSSYLRRSCYAEIHVHSSIVTFIGYVHNERWPSNLATNGSKVGQM